MFLYVTKELAAEIKMVLECSPQWQLQENTWNTFERGADIIVVEQYADMSLDMVAMFRLDAAPVDEVRRILDADGMMMDMLWAWIEAPKSSPRVAPAELEYCEAPF